MDITERLVVFRQQARHVLTTCIPGLRKSIARSKFRAAHGYLPDLEHPRSLSEKLQWISLHHDLGRLAPFVDKHLVRDFVRRRVGESRLVPLLGVYDRFADIDFDSLPERFVMKATHGSGWNIRVADKKALDQEQARRQLRRWMLLNLGLITGESCYTPLRGRILIEEYLGSPQHDLIDFKFYCIDGEPLGLHVDFNRYGDHTYRIYDTQWNEFHKSGPVHSQPPVLAKPPNLEEMLEVCRRLSAGFSCVRVDLYNPGNRVYFGELTFVPGNGMSPFDPVWSDYYFGERLDVRRYVPALQETPGEE